MSNENSCACCSAPTLIFACSGAADVGAVADQAARKMTQDGVGRMFCLAGIGGRVSGIVKSTEAAGKILAIDGCPISCAKHCLEGAGFSEFAHLQLGDLGMAKGATPANDENVAKAVEAGTERLAESCQG